MREALVAAVLLVGLILALVADYLREGTFLADDWVYRAAAFFADENPFEATATNWENLGHHRPGMALFLGFQYAIVGSRITASLALVAGTAALSAAALYALARQLRAPRTYAALAAVLFLLFPYTTATRLWGEVSFINVCILLFLLGAIAALAATRRSGQRAGWLAATAVAAWAPIPWTYESLSALVGVALLLLACRAGRSPARRVAIAGIVIVIASVLWIMHDPYYPSEPLSTQVDHAWVLLRDGMKLLGMALLPIDGFDPLIAILAIAVMLAVAATLARRSAPDSPLRAQTTPWLVAAGVGVAVIALGYAPYIPGSPHFAPTNVGIGDRTNAVSSAGHALVIAAVLMLLGALVHQLLRGRVPAAAVAGVLGVALAVVYASDLRDRADEYAAATPIQQDVLTMLREELPAPADSQTLLAFNYPRNAVWGVPTFNWWWDLTNAYRMAWRNQSIVAIPVTPDAGIACGASELRARGPSLAGAPPARYGNVLAVDIGRRQVAAIDDRQSCRTAVTGLLPAVDVPTR